MSKLKRMIGFKKLSLLICALLFDISIFAQSGVTIIDSIYSNGTYRSYRLYIPSNYSGIDSVPLILNLHGYSSNAEEQQIYTNFMPIADTAGFLMVYPQGLQDPYNSEPFWNAGIVSTSIVNDTLFLNQLIDSLSSTYNIDISRIYMTGMSNGGFMSHYMACFCNRKITAIASVTGSWFTWWPSCTPGKVIPVMQIHGTDDSTVPYNGNSDMVSIETIINNWVNINDCNSTPTYSMIPDIDTTDGSTAEHYQYFSNSFPKALVEFFKINNGGHTWPGASIIIGPTNQDINASAEIWRFFRQFSNSDFSTQLLSHNAIENTFTIYPNPAQKTIHVISTNDNIKTLEITDITGKVVYLKSLSGYQKHFIVDITNLAKGFYFVKLNNYQIKTIIKE